MLKFCPKCGADLNEGVNFCESCGLNLTQLTNSLKSEPILMENRSCPKCESSSINYADKIYSGGGFGGKEYIGLGLKRMGGMESRFVAYICNDCGYSELYLVKG